MHTGFLRIGFSFSTRVTIEIYRFLAKKVSE